MNYFSYLFSFNRFRLIQKLHPHGTLVLLYHSISDRKKDPLHLSVSPKNFNSQLEHLNKRYRLISPLEYATSLSKRVIIPQSILITFDDGYADNLTQALPILKKHNIPALFFVTSDFIQHNHHFWWEKHNQLPTHQYNKAKFSHQSSRLKPSLPYQPLTKLQLKRLSSSPLVTLGGHTHTHPQLSLLTPLQQSKQIKKNYHFLSSYSRQPLQFFAYPYGHLTDYNHHSITAVSQLYDYAFTTMPFVSNFHYSPFELPRLPVPNISGPKLVQRLKRAFPWH